MTTLSFPIACATNETTCALAKHQTVLVLGAGISGLIAAYRLQKLGYTCVVVEKSNKAGGAIRSEFIPLHEGSEAGYLLEWGPNSFPSSSSELMSLLEELQLRPVSTSPTAKHRFITKGYRLIEAPSDPLTFATSPLLSFGDKLRLMKEPFTRRFPWHDEPDPSVQRFFTYRFGKAFHQNLIAPLLCGIYAGDTETLGVASVFPFLKTWEQQHGSVTLGALMALFKKMNEQRQQPDTPSKNRRKNYRLLNFEGGMASLIHKLASQLPAEALKLQHEVMSLRYDTSDATQPQWLAEVLQPDGSSAVLKADRVICTLPAYEAARLIDPLQNEAAALLNGVDYAPLWVAYQAFKKEACASTLKGFGTLKIPYSEYPTTAWLGALWSSSLFPTRSPRDEHLVCHFIGGVLAPEVRLWSKEKVQELALQRSQWMLETTTSPTFEQAYYWHKATPQYAQGHLERMQRVTNLLRQRAPGLVLAGNYVNGINLNSCVKVANQAVAEAVIVF
ncbi:MAG: protoporphyrinogen oxidase [Vampirovibrionales bacterium]